VSIRTKLAAAGASIALTAGVVAALGPASSIASSHREAPLTSAEPQIDQTDLYAFIAPDRPNRVTFVSSWLPFQEPAGGPNFYLWAERTNYDINIDNDGDARADVTFRWRFTTHHRNGGDSFLNNNGVVDSLNDPNLLVYQTYDLWRLREGREPVRLLDDAKVVPSHVGDASMPTYNADLFDAGTRSFGDHNRSWVGQSDDPFFLDLRVFDLIYGGDFSEAGDDTLAGFNVNTMVLQVNKGMVRGADGPIIGIWNTASRRGVRVLDASGGLSDRGDLVQVSRLGMPLVNEVVVPVAAKDYFNASKPRQDAQFLDKVQDPELPHVVSTVYPSVFPNVPDSDPDASGVQRADLVSVFLTGVEGLNMPEGVRPSEMLRLNLSIAPCTDACSTLGVIGGDTAGFPNGRRLDDDIVDIALRVVMGVLLPEHDADADGLADGVDANDVAFLDAFPYVAYPHSGSDASPH
jgi:hypothetical protein